MLERPTKSLGAAACPVPRAHLTPASYNAGLEVLQFTASHVQAKQKPVALYQKPVQQPAGNCSGPGSAPPPQLPHRSQSRSRDPLLLPA